MNFNDSDDVSFIGAVYSLAHLLAPGDDILQSLNKNQVTTGDQASLEPSNDATKQQSSMARRECGVCALEPNKGEFPASSPTQYCSHTPELCLECLQQVILVAITDGSYVSGIECPSNPCSQKLDYFDVKKWARKEDFDRYDKMLLQDSLRTDERYVRCINPTCSAGQEHAGGDDNYIVRCYACGMKQCFKHQVQWHEGWTCDQWDVHVQTTEKNEGLSHEWISKGTKPCPSEKCGRRIQKIDGCDHVVCKRPGGCGFQFCWECLAPWKGIIENDNSYHYHNCKYYTGSSGARPPPPRILAALGASSSPAVPQRETPQVTNVFQFLERRARRFPRPALAPSTPAPGHGVSGADPVVADAQMEDAFNWPPPFFPQATSSERRPRSPLPLLLPGPLHGPESSTSATRRMGSVLVLPSTPTFGSGIFGADSDDEGVFQAPPRPFQLRAPISSERRPTSPPLPSAIPGLFSGPESSTLAARRMRNVPDSTTIRSLNRRGRIFEDPDPVDTIIADTETPLRQTPGRSLRQSTASEREEVINARLGRLGVVPSSTHGRDTQNKDETLDQILLSPRGVLSRNASGYTRSVPSGERFVTPTQRDQNQTPQPAPINTSVASGLPYRLNRGPTLLNSETAQPLTLQENSTVASSSIRNPFNNGDERTDRRQELVNRLRSEFTHQDTRAPFLTRSETRNVSGFSWLPRRERRTRANNLEASDSSDELVFGSDMLYREPRLQPAISPSSPVAASSSLLSPSYSHRPTSELGSGSSMYPFQQLAYAALARTHGGGNLDAGPTTRQSAMARLAARLQRAEAPSTN